MKSVSLQIDNPVEHIPTGALGIILGYAFEASKVWLHVDWVSTEGIALNVPVEDVRALPTEMHLLAAV